jgi:hypothetical protein
MFFSGIPIDKAIFLALTISAATPGRESTSGDAYSAIPIINAARLFFSCAWTLIKGFKKEHSMANTNNPRAIII